MRRVTMKTKSVPVAYPSYSTALLVVGAILAVSQPLEAQTLAQHDRDEPIAEVGCLLHVAEPIEA